MGRRKMICSSCLYLFIVFQSLTVRLHDIFELLGGIQFPVFEGLVKGKKRVKEMIHWRLLSGYGSEHHSNSQNFRSQEIPEYHGGFRYRLRKECRQKRIQPNKVITQQLTATFSRNCSPAWADPACLSSRLHGVMHKTSKAGEKIN